MSKGDINYKVLHIIDHSGCGGAQVIIDNLAKKNVDDFHFCILRKVRDNFVSVSKRVFFLNSRGKYDPLILFQLLKYIKRENISLLHVHLFKSTIIGIMIKLLFKQHIKLVVHEHGEIHTGNRFYRFFLRVFRKRINIFVAISKRVKQELHKHAGIEKNKMEVLNNPIDPRAFIDFPEEEIENLRKKYDLGKNEFVVGFIGRLMEVKGCQYLIKAFGAIDNRISNLIIVGDGEYRDELEGLASAVKNSKKIIFAGYISRRGVFKHLKIFDLLVIPSLKEGFGIVVLEGLATKTPVITSDIKGIREIIKHNDSGLLIKPRDVKGIKEAITCLYERKVLYEKFKNRGYQNAKKYNVENYIDNLKKIYEKTLENNS